MNKSIFFYKELTLAEVGKTGTHEVYVRFPNNFDYDSFFCHSAVQNDTVKEVNFEATDLTEGMNLEKVPLRFVFFEQSNQEKRVPSLGTLFNSRNVEEGDVVCFESRIVDDIPSYYICFYKKGVVKINPSAIYYVKPEIHQEIFTKLKESKGDKILQQIYYGAPGTGKSKTIKDQTIEAEKEGRVFRTTFHPDSDYSTFVGCYKPGMKSGDRIYSAEELAVKLKEIKNSGVTYPCHKFAAQYWRSLKDLSADVIKQILNACGFTESMNVEISKGIAIGQEYLNKDEDGKIIYTFTPQAFTNAYVKAWNTTENVYLIIEEINRGNCAQIFGDLFQLLDRDDDGKSEYPIEADTDLGSYIAKELESSTRSDFPDGVKDGKKLVLPSNLYIWATMNTSDQSLFPIDSAFKRRWDWQYVPIHDGRKGWQIEADGKRYDWWQFVDAMNDKIGAATYSEDKKLGYFFCKAKDGAIDAETFVGKVVFYIWNDVFKDFAEEAGNLFKDVDGSMLSFNKFYTIGTDGKRMVVEPKIAILMQNLGVEPITTSNSTNDDEPEEDEDNNDDSGSKVRLTITFPDGDVIAGNTKFESYRGALEKIGIQQTLPIAEEKVYQRHNCSLIDTTQRDGILNDPVYSYVKVGDYYIVKGINGKTMRNMLSLISNRLNLDLIINYQ